VAVTRRSLFAPLEPFDHGYLDVGDGHRIYYEQCGNPNGKAALFVHGGPGGGGDITARRFFDPSSYRIVLFDQRGAGRSTPRASLTANTTWHLVADMELLRKNLSIKKWLVFGGSWGSTLSIAYAQRYPGVVSELVLRGIFLLRKKEIHWFYQSGASEIYPDQWELFIAPIPQNERYDLLSAYHRRLLSDDIGTRLAAAKAWSIWEGATSFLHFDASRTKRFGTPDFAIALARIEAHYFINYGFFSAENELLAGIDLIRHIPAVIVQGRYDVVCPMTSAWELAKCWPEADLRIIGDAGHSAYEPGITHELIAATESFLINK
jgi:proline iminopeptidase